MKLNARCLRGEGRKRKGSGKAARALVAAIDKIKLP
jgi:hypothetical protein